MPPTSPTGFIPLHEAIEWIAWRGAGPTNDEAWAQAWADADGDMPGHEAWHQWDAAQEALRVRAELGEIEIRGQTQGWGESRAVPASAWAPTTTIRPLYAAGGGALCLLAPNGLPENEPTYQRIRVNVGQLLEFWPSREGGAFSKGPHGFPGRPAKLKQAIEREFQRRLDAGEALPGLWEEATALLEWTEATHPDADRPTLKTITNNIRDTHRQAFLRYA